MRRPLLAATAAYVAGQSAHTTFMYYLVPLALRSGGLAGDSILFTLTAVAMGAAVVPAGRLADRVPRRRVLRAGLVLLALAYAPLLAPPAFPLLVLGTLATGTGLALLFVSFQSYVADLLVDRERGAAYGRTTALSILAGATGPFLAAIVYDSAASAPGGIVRAAILFLVLTLAALAFTWGLPSARHEPRPRDVRENLRAAAPVMVVYVFVGLGYGLTLPYFAVFFLDHVGLSGAAWGYALAAATLATAAGSWLAGRHAARRGVLVSLAGHAALLLASLAFLLPLTAAGFVAAYVARQLFSSTSAPVMATTLMARVRVEARAEAHGWSSLAWNAGWASGAALGGLLLAGAGAGAFAVGAGVALGGVVGGARMLARPQPAAA